MAIGQVTGMVNNIVGAVSQLAGKGGSESAKNEAGQEETQGQQGRNPVEQIAEGVTGLISGFLGGPKG